MSNLKFPALTVPEIWMGPKIRKVGHVTPPRPANSGVASDPIFGFPDPDLPI